MERSEGDMSLKNPMTPPGMDSGTVRLVAQRLNHYATPGPLSAITLRKTALYHTWYLRFPLTLRINAYHLRTPIAIYSGHGVYPLRDIK
jgi:hypothetical protein